VVSGPTEEGVVVHIDRAGDGPSIRVQVDPMVTALTGAVELLGPLAHRTPPQLRARAQRLSRGLPLEPLLRLLTDPLGPGIPDTFGFPQGGPDMPFGVRLEQLRAVPEEDVRRDLAAYGRIPGASLDVYRDWLDHPQRALARVCQSVWCFWTEVLCALYPDPVGRLYQQARQLEAILDGHGPAAMFATLNAPIKVQESDVTVNKRLPKDWPYPRQQRKTLILKPMICSPATFMTNALFQGEEVLVVGCSTATLSSRRQKRAAGNAVDPLPDLLGVTRTRLLRAVARRPSTTTELAAELSIAPSTVSHHLSVLTSTGVLACFRNSSAVIYHLTERGHRLMGV
jgi:DNA-binding transcriptional ArsR family regulator